MLFVLLASIVIGIHAYDPYNYNPFQADPSAAIECYGPLAYLDYIVPAGQRRSDIWLRSVCAQTQYYGYPGHYNQGGYCGTRPEDGRRVVKFFQFPDAPASSRVKAMCQLRCRCSGIPEEDRAPALSFDPIHHYMNPFPLRVINLSNRKTVPERIEIQRPDETPRAFIRIPVVSPIRRPNSQVVENEEIRHSEEYVTLSKKNLVVCEGELPTFRLPYPAQGQYFETLQELCAVHLSGGNATMNAGAFCHRTRNLIGRKVADVLFSDEMTPIKEWTWNYDDYFPRTPLSTSSLELRHYCYEKCRCARETQEQVKRPWADIFKIGAGDFLRQLETSSDQSSSMGSGHSSQSSLCSTSTATVSCFGVIRQYQLIADYLPKAWKPLFDPPKRSSTGAGICNIDCDGPGKCLSETSRDCPYSGQCRVDPFSLTTKVVGSLGNVVTAFTSYCALKNRRPQPKLGGRDVINENQDESLSWPCACNATYASRGCCSVLDGIVREDPRLNEHLRASL